MLLNTCTLLLASDILDLVSKLQARAGTAAPLVGCLPSMQEAWGSVPSPHSLASKPIILALSGRS